MKSTDKYQAQRANYGQDMKGIVIFAASMSLLFLSLAFWQFIAYISSNCNYKLNLFIIVAAFAILFIFITIVSIWSSRRGKLKLRDKLMNNLKLNGTELILDLGCGNGLLLLEAAKRIPLGKAIGADNWSKTLEYQYNAQMVLNNAKIEGVLDRIEVITADALSIPFPENSFDVVMTSLMIHHISDKAQVFKEMLRVLKPEGIVIIADVMAKRYITVLELLEVKDISSKYATRLFFMPVYLVKGSKSNRQITKSLNH
jgi:arsenite methyltransferase